MGKFRKNILAVSITILVFFVILTAQPTAPDSGGNPVASPNQSTSQSTVENTDEESRHLYIALGIGGMSAQVGGIVVVFVAFAIQELRQISSQTVTQEDEYKNMRFKSRLNMLLVNAVFSITALLVGPIIMAFCLLHQLLTTKLISNIGLGFFVFGIFTMLFSILMYLILEKSFRSVLSPE